jgi:hypothetical protein
VGGVLASQATYVAVMDGDLQMEFCRFTHAGVASALKIQTRAGVQITIERRKILSEQPSDSK